MESRYSTTAEPFSAIQSERRSLGGFDRDGDRFDGAWQSDREAARSKLGIDRTFPEEKDDRIGARRKLYGDRSEPNPVITDERSETTAQYAQSSRLFIGEAFGESAFAKKDRTIDESYLKPSATTMQYERYGSVEDFLGEEAAPKTTAARTPLTKKQKISIAIYSSIVVVIAALNGLKSQTDEAAGAYQQSVERLTQVESSDYLKTQAENLGMTEGTDATRLSLLATTETPEYTAPTNGFDRFCDWLSKVFG